MLKSASGRPTVNGFTRILRIFTDQKIRTTKPGILAFLARLQGVQVGQDR